jgi:protein-disulfide isomerase
MQIHPGALLAAHAANCAGAQDSYWPMHSRLFQGQDAGEWGQGDARDLQTFKSYAVELKLDVAAFEQCVKENRFAPVIENDYNQAIQQGIRSTPSFLINGEPFIGAQPFSAWQQKLDSLLADK